MGMRPTAIFILSICLSIIAAACGPAAVSSPAPAPPTGSSVIPAAAASPATSAALPTVGPIVIHTLTDLRALVREIAAAPSAVAQARADALWETLVSG